MAQDQTQQFNEHTPKTDVEGITAPNVKRADLAEVEQDAMRIQEKRFKDAQDDREYEQSKAAAKEEKKGN